MFDQFLKLIELILGKLPDLDLGHRRKREFARSLIDLHGRSLQIVTNGREILDNLDRYRDTGDVEPEHLISLIAAQEALIQQVSALLEDHKYANVLKAKLPFVLPLQTYKDKKAGLQKIRVYFSFHLVPNYLDCGVAEQLRQDVFEYGFEMHPPSEKLSRHNREVLADLEASSRRLGQFLDRSFDVEDLL